MKEKHLFFDLDRTLWDFEANSELTLQHLFEHLQLNRHIAEFNHFFEVYKRENALLWKAYGLNQVSKSFLRNKRFERTLAVFSVHNNKLVEQMSDGYIELSPKQKALHENALETLDLLKRDGYHMHIVTNGFKEVQHTKLKESGLSPFFKVVICSEEIGKNKPSPEIFHYAMKQANADSKDSVMIGDDLEADVIGALNAGMHAVHFLPDPKKLGSREDFCTISNLNQLPALLPRILQATF
jgi:putative hydrolase of the HAD superfamily